MTNPVTLTGMTWDHPRAYDSLVAASARWHAQTGVQINWEKRSLQDFADVPIHSLADAYDLVILDHPHVGQIAESGCLLPLPPMPIETSMGGSVESYMWNGKYWAWPIDGACQMAVVRPDMDAPFPTHWDEVLTASATDFRLVTALKPVDAFDLMLTMVASRGEEKLPFSATEFCSRANGERALAVLKALFKFGPQEAVEWNPIHVLEILSESDDFAGSPALFGYVNYARPGFRKHQLRYVDLPVFSDTGARRSILGGAGIGVSARRQNAEAAKDFAAWVTSEPIQSGVYLENEGQPAHIDTWRAKQNDPTYAGFFKGGFETMRTAWTRPRDAWFLHFVDDACAVFPDFFLKDMSESAFMDQLNALYQNALKKADQ
ncbi:ABC transporter substrate-binding protein [Celeribacter sp.]|uniref:ABC transporter substrate-binding protein n=1 Tax=Celeribacter sp. TaxID=1890673 RepID=UPI003A8EF2DA